MTKNHNGPHKYVKVLLGRNQDYQLYKCIISGCTHNMQPALMLGLVASCYDCGEEFTVTSKTDLIEKLKCAECRSGPEINDHEVLKLLEEMPKDEV